MSKKYFIECTVTEFKIPSKGILVLFKIKGVKGFLYQDVKESKEFNIFFPCDIGTMAGLPDKIDPCAIVLDTNSSIAIGTIRTADANILQILVSSISQGRKIRLEFDGCENKNGYFSLDKCDITIY